METDARIRIPVFHALWTMPRFELKSSKAKYPLISWLFLILSWIFPYLHIPVYFTFLNLHIPASGILHFIMEDVDILRVTKKGNTLYKLQLSTKLGSLLISHREIKLRVGYWRLVFEAKGRCASVNSSRVLHADISPAQPRSTEHMMESGLTVTSDDFSVQNRFKRVILEEESEVLKSANLEARREKR